MKIIWVMVVLVFADGEWRDWNSYNRLEECLEVARVLTYHRENVLEIKCEPRRQKSDKEE